jgi:PAS domain S-box-containing protein
MNQLIHVLYVDDNPHDRALVRDALEKEHGGFQVIEAASRDAFEVRLADGGYDLVLTDFNILGFEGLQVLNAVQAQNPDLPVLIVTGTGSEEVAVEAMKRGAADYVLKTPNHIRRLPITIQAALEKKALRDERQRAEEALRQSEAKFSAIFQTNPEPSAVTRLQDGQIKEVNEAFLRVTGYAKADLIGKSTLDLRLLTDAAERERIVDELRRVGEIRNLETRPQMADGSLRTFLVSATAVEIDGEPCLLTIARDVTDLKAMEAALQEIQARLQLAARASTTGLWDWNLRTNQAYLSPEWKRQLGYEDDEMPNRFEEWESRLHPEDHDRMMKTIQAYLENPWPNYETEFRLRHKDGSYRWILSRAEALFDDQEKPWRMLGSHIDITERKQAEEERERLLDQLRAGREQLQSLSRQLMMAHESERRALSRELHDEVGQLLTGLKLVLEIGGQQAEGPVRENLSEAQTLVNDLMARVRDLSLNLRPAMLDDLGLLPALVWHFERYTAQTKVEVTLKHTGLEGRRFAPEIETAAYRIVQEALTNVARHAGVSDATVRLWADHDTLGLQIEDRGAGFDPDAVLAAGATTGLAGMRERAVLLGGQLTIESQIGAGTRLTAELPIA